ncbi:hypothetical protein BJP36_39835 [Moorena producens JHB]|uniref:Uncharacterized protein n=1 Tax=Moorena producens (strain JHB) TaxID=1454205 RepID=A0A9Q9SV45_MOOP1|nr:hypothetical protein [Moorena producens]WAN70208.1 hypothetical protein BJP36_39835 [Moorena producens JHB]
MPILQVRPVANLIRQGQVSTNLQPSTLAKRPRYANNLQFSTLAKKPRYANNIQHSTLAKRPRYANNLQPSSTFNSQQALITEVHTVASQAHRCTQLQFDGTPHHQ